MKTTDFYNKLFNTKFSTHLLEIEKNIHYFIAIRKNVITLKNQYYYLYPYCKFLLKNLFLNIENNKQNISEMEAFEIGILPIPF